MVKQMIAALMTAAAFVPAAALAQDAEDGRSRRGDIQRMREQRNDAPRPNVERRAERQEARAERREERAERPQRQPDQPRPAVTADAQGRDGWRGRNEARVEQRVERRAERQADQPRGDWRGRDRGQVVATPQTDVRVQRQAEAQVRADAGRRANDGRRSDGNRFDGSRRWDNDRRDDNRVGNRGWDNNQRWNGNRDGRQNWAWNGGRTDWSRRWRDDNRYDWGRYRQQNRNLFRLPRYYAPYDWTYGYRRYSIGVTLSSLLWSQNYWIDDPWSYRLPEAYEPYRWVRYYNDALLVDLRSGEVVDTVYDIFWGLMPRGSGGKPSEPPFSSPAKAGVHHQPSEMDPGFRRGGA